MESLDALFIFRLTMFMGMLFHATAFVLNIIQTYDTFNPSYWRHYVRQHCIRPLIGCAIFGLLLMADEFMVEWLSS